MNEQFKALALQAGLEQERWTTTDEFHTFLNKFAHLVVKECIKVIVNGGYWSGGILGGPKRPATPPEIAMMLKEHFGVES